MLLMRESTTMRPTPAAMASRSSWGVLLLPLHEHALHREINGLCQRQLAAARHIEAEAMRVHEAADRLVQERLRSIDDIGIGIARSERIAIGFHAVLKVCLVVHVERRAEFFGNFHHVHATDMKMTIDDLGGHRQGIRLVP